MTPFFRVAIVVFLCLSLTEPTDGYLTIPHRQLGFVYKPDTASTSAKLTLSVYIDNTCPDSKAAFPTMLQVADHFGPKNLRLVSHLFSLPYHRNSHTIAKAAHVIDAYSKGKATYAWFNIVYDHQDQLTTAATANLTDIQVMDILVPLAQNVSGISDGELTSKVLKRSIDAAARLGWKYVCTRGVYGAPTFMINDVIVPADYKWTVEQWVNLIESLLD